MHGLLQSRPGRTRCEGKFIENSAEDHQGDLSVMVALRTRKLRLCDVKTLCDELHENLAKCLLFASSLF